MKQKLYYLLSFFWISYFSIGQNATHLNFDGTNDFVLSTNQITTNTENQSYQLWFRIPALPANNDRLIQRGSDSTGGWSVQMDVTSTGKLSAGISASPDTFITGTTTLNTNTWYLATFVFENNNALRLYLNGNLEASIAIGNRVLRNSDNKLRVGSGNIASEFFRGDIDDVRVWNIALTQTEIMNSMNCELQGNETGLALYYKFNQGVDQANNTTITNSLDATTNNNNGILTNFTLNGTTSNWLAGSPIFTPGNPIVSSPIIYNQGTTASVLTATTGSNGTGLMWYTTATGGTGYTTAPTPNTATAGTTSYWVSSTNANGCESARTQIVVNVIVANNECSNAINLTVGASSFNDFPVNVNLTTATNSGTPTPTCGNFQGGDVWYTATIPASGNIVIETNGAGNYDTGLEIYSGTCGTFSLVTCDDNTGNNDYSKIILLGQTPGTVLYIRVWENFWGNSNAQFQVAAYDYVVPATHLKFDGTNDFVLSTNQITTNTENQSYQLWFRIPALPANNDRLIQRGSDSTGGWSVQMDVTSTGKLSAGISASPDTFITGTTTLNTNTWYLATFVFENNNALRLYLNGNLEASIAIGNRVLRNSDNKLRVGSGNIASEYFNGEIDEVRVWNAALTSTDILNTMNCELQGIQNNLKIYYKFNQGFDSINNSTVTSATDNSGNTNNGTLTNFTLNGATSNWKAGSVMTTGTTCTTLGNPDFVNNSSELKIYPNPSNGYFTIETEEELSITVYDLIGKLIYTNKAKIGINQIDLNNFENGIYILNHIDNIGNNNSIKLIKN
ncbi:Protein of unknown function precursor; putative adhesin [Flavobacterium indicum GPTSA100-9 = DSM 17447]|uniref:LamG-like jellyroll fold domain-containing protein n=1 Tax=Flavobacterium indicum (strain DSM 17447 / CIP 109464 / GPTSA100-9) TaxID=1094466 RepID=H8XQA9_FLAIG|nr:LamG-like jellyroll fold domain-containing protein [Flavobacterium indicum]CCG52403.1 Protein of unknown function precursor; putative adhesin [Flavobacterium indicum GPTSA100-9 = DSM 17447]